MNYESITKQYLNDLEQEYNRAINVGHSTPELSYHPVLDTFFRQITQIIQPNADIIFEPKKQQNAGRPDWRFYDSENYGVYGYVEAKSFDPLKKIVQNIHGDQINQYLELGNKLILTDGLDFVFFDQDGGSQVLSLIDKPLKKANWGSLEPNPMIETKFKDFLKVTSFTRCSETQLIKEVAKRTVRLSKTIMTLSEAPLNSGLDDDENRVIEILHDLKSILTNHHDPVLKTAEIFSDFVAQVLAFGLLYAHRVILGEEDTPTDRYRKMVEFWLDKTSSTAVNNLLPFYALSELLEQELAPSNGTGSVIGAWYDDCRRLLAHVQLDETQRETPDYHILYENFLSEFDPQTRFDYGAFYTPSDLAKYTVNLSDAVAQSELKKMSLYDPGNKLIDPCCGTGTFLEQLINHKKANDSKAQVIGFEILPAPYALAHYRLSMLAKNHPNTIVLTNTLSDDLEIELGRSPRDLIEKEQETARSLAKPPLILIIGNPPSSDSFAPHTSGPNFGKVQEKLEKFRPPSDERVARQNTQKQLQNDFIKFMAWACDKLGQASHGIFALVIPGSFAENESYKHARKWLISNFQKLWLLDIDLDSRTGACTSNLFNTLQGRSLLVGLWEKKRKKENFKFYYRSITNLSRSRKLEELSYDKDVSELIGDFSEINISDDDYLFRPPLQPFDDSLYSKFWPLHPAGNEPTSGEKYIFERHVSGIKFAPSSMFVHTDKNLLLRRSKDIANEQITVNDIKNKWFSGQDRPPPDAKFSSSVRQEIGNAIAGGEKRLNNYSYRPLLNTHALISKNVLDKLAQVGGGGTRSRPEVISAFDCKTTIGIAIAPSRKDIGEELHRFASFCWSYPDNDLAKRGNAHVLCNKFPAYKANNPSWDPTPLNNINQKVIDKLSKNGQKSSGQDMVYYAYAILCSDTFLNAFNGALFTVSGSANVPRIPICNDALLFRAVVRHGKALARLENPILMDRPTKLYDYFEDLYDSPFKLIKYKIDVEKEMIEFFDDSGEAVISLKYIPKELLIYTISGYQVLEQWLKYYSYRYTRKTFSKKDFQKFISLLSTIRAQLRIIRRLDELLKPLIEGKINLL